MLIKSNIISDASATEPEKGKYKTRTITSMFAPKPKKPKHGQDRNDYNNDESKEDAMAVESDRKVSAA